MNRIKQMMKQAKEERKAMTNTAVQMAFDAACFAAHEVFQMGPGRAKAFQQAYQKAWMEIAKTITSDTQDLEYSKAKIDDGLKEIIGKDFVPWEERYK